MATPNVGILTTTGKALIDKVNSGQAKISFSKVVFSSMDNSQLSDTQIKALTAIAPQEVVVSSPQTTLDTNSGETRIRATGTNEKLADGVYVKTYGVFAKDDTGNEILYGVTVSPNPNYFPAYDGVTPQAVTYSYKTVIQETSNITMTNSNDVYVSQEDLTEAIAKIPQPDLSGYDKTDDVDKKLQNKQDKLGFAPADDAKVLHNSGLSKMPADNSGLVIGNNGDIGIVKQANNFGSIVVGKGNTFHVVQSNNISIGIADTFHDMFKVNGNYQISLGSGEYFTPADDSKVVHTADMRKPASDVAGIEEVNAKQNLIGYTPADDSKVVHNSGNEEIGGQKTFDVAPIDKTTGNPYITRDGVPSIPSDVARTSQQTNFTAGLQSGGVNVATAADLNNYYHANASDDAALAAAKAATVPGIFWFEEV
ncbi:hypothetical protein ORR04_13825 (plasmid) [Levilactobacillus brevis]|uniref:Uncharacterized protein n=1 Tax=Levilactobacillus brevis TaxID=1580 RepID=A0AB38X993_LEVBR|nr:hypothetical protein [Levilactobacillus brevis]WAD03152.1 hypothetical protein ORR04_13825 [Levilactobacillus brevis]